jgi:hypothetical protein
VPTVEGGEPLLSKPLEERDDAGVDDPEAEIAVVRLELAATRNVGLDQSLQPVGPALDVLEERKPDIRVKTSVTPVVELGEHEYRDDEVLRGIFEEVDAREMVGVVAVQGRQENTGVDDERH